ncbi:MAG TPA: isocitrate lyase/phosphoenolpyruvate mutase family protein [Rhizobiaceae bacterium]|nr:isocitrate lyase/phosphoenolpyruvate mutase family protein [Rhizobiaceae bacterium]
MASKAKSEFRKLHEGPGAFLIPNPWDIGTAKVLAALGFKALATTSAGFAFSRGLPDGAIPFEQRMAHCREIVGATGLPVSADLEKGKGDMPDSAAETIFAAEAAGLAGCSIEDSTGDPGRPIFDFGLAVERVTAAVEAARALNRDFVFTARCENFLWGKNDLDDTIKRLQAYEKAGADVLYAPGLTDIDMVRAICSSVSKPVNVLAVHQLSLRELSAAGVRRVSLGSRLTNHAFFALEKACREMLDHGTFTFARETMRLGSLQVFFSNDAAK